MTPGTFEALCRDPQIWLQNNDNYWDVLKGNVIGSILHIVSNNPQSGASCAWKVVAEGKDEAVVKWDKTDDS